MQLVFVVDDELHIRQQLESGLQESGFITRSFEQSDSFLRALKTTRPDAIVLDWMLPDGAELIKMLRADVRTRAIPIVLLTACDNESKSIAGLELGADDYIKKPVSIKELSARIRSILRRDEYLRDDKNVRLCFGGLELDVPARRVYFKADEVFLTMREFDLLSVLMKNKGRVLTRKYLLDTVWGLDYEGDTRTLDVHISYLRKKLNGKVIDTIRGVGYRFCDDMEKA
ncbi:response regulator transcription factor [Eubacteriales bacterium OttesenSCG-928-K08]|nr:response regulator transcription factor [Eubacteriales bacterium OttesenSCG-928-K08]